MANKNFCEASMDLIVGQLHRLHWQNVPVKQCALVSFFVLFQNSKLQRSPIHLLNCGSIRRLKRERTFPENRKTSRVRAPIKKSKPPPLNARLHLRLGHLQRVSLHSLPRVAFLLPKITTKPTLRRNRPRHHTDFFFQQRTRNRTDEQSTQ